MKTKIESIQCPACRSDKLKEKWPAHKIDKDKSILWCADCGFGWQKPLPTVKEITDYYESTTPYNIHGANEKEKAAAIRIRRIETLMPAKGRLLDVGSGLGYFLDQAQKAGWEVTGLEPQRSAALFCRNRFGIKVHTGTVQDNDLSDKLFDVITLWDVWEHVHEPLEFLNACISSLAPGGLLVIAVPNASGWPARCFKGNWRYVMKTHLNYFTLPYVRRIFSKEGLMIEKTYQTIKVQSLLQGFLSRFPFHINTEKIIRLGRENSDEEGRPEQKGEGRRIEKMGLFKLFFISIRRVVLKINLFPMPGNSGDLMELYCRKIEKNQVNHC